MEESHLKKVKSIYGFIGKHTMNTLYQAMLAWKNALNIMSDEKFASETSY